MQSELEALLAAAWQAVAARKDRRTGAAVEIPPLVPLEAPAVESRYAADFPVLRHLGAALALARRCALAELAARFERLLGGLAWSQNPGYDARNCEAAFLDGYAYAAFSGPEGPVYCAAPRGGALLMAPHVTYPGHKHAPKEVYLILTPGAQWRLDAGEWFDVSPGDLIVHAPWVTHSMRTTRHPLLAFAGWLEPGDRRDIAWSDHLTGEAGR